MSVTDKTWFVGAVVLYGICTLYSLFLYRKGFQRHDRINYILLLIAFCLHTFAMVQRGFSLSRCPINNLYEAAIFITWTMLAVYLPIGAWPRLRFLGAFAAPLLFGVGVFALMPALDVASPTPTFSGGWAGLHKALILLAFGAYGLSCVAGIMYLTQEHDLKAHKARAVLSVLPPIQRLEFVIGRLLFFGMGLLSMGLVTSALYLKESHGVYFNADPLMIYLLFVWAIYLSLLILRWGYQHRGRRFAWGAVLTFGFIMITFWGMYMLSGLHQPAS